MRNRMDREIPSCDGRTFFCLVFELAEGISIRSEGNTLERGEYL